MFAGYCEKEILEQHDSFVKMCPEGALSRKKFLEVSKDLYGNQGLDFLNPKSEAELIVLLLCISSNSLDQYKLTKIKTNSAITLRVKMIFTSLKVYFQQKTYQRRFLTFLMMIRVEKLTL